MISKAICETNSGVFHKDDAVVTIDGTSNYFFLPTANNTLLSFSQKWAFKAVPIVFALKLRF